MTNQPTRCLAYAGAMRTIAEQRADFEQLAAQNEGLKARVVELEKAYEDVLKKNERLQQSFTREASRARILAGKLDAARRRIALPEETESEL